MEELAIKESCPSTRHLSSQSEQTRTQQNTQSEATTRQCSVAAVTLPEAGPASSAACWGCSHNPPGSLDPTSHRYRTDLQGWHRTCHICLHIRVHSANSFVDLPFPSSDFVWVFCSVLILHKALLLLPLPLPRRRLCQPLSSPALFLMQLFALAQSSKVSHFPICFHIHGNTSRTAHQTLQNP